MSNLRDKLNKLVDVHGLDYEKLIETDKALHKEIIVEQMLIIERSLNRGA